MSFLDNQGVSSCYFVTNQKNLMSILSAGMLVPSHCQFRYRTDSREFASGGVLFWKGGLPQGDNWRSQIEDKRSVIVEYSLDDLEKYGARCVAYENESSIVINAPIPFGLASGLYMASPEAIDDFLLRVPSDVTFDRSLFHPAPVFPELANAELPEIQIPDISADVMAIDSFAGGVNGIKNYPREIGLDVFCAIPAVLTFLSVLSPANVKWGGDAVELTLSDQILLTALMPLLNEYKEENGFDPMEFLNWLEGNICDNEGKVPEELIKWFSYVRALINAEKEVRPLSDEGDIIQRATLLFILRPELERLVSAQDSSVSPGPKVLLIAMFFAGCASGISRMGAEFKGDFPSHARHVKAVVDALWNKSKLNARVIKSATKGKGTSTAFEINGEVLIEAESTQDLVLARVLNQARSLGYELQYDLESDELIYETHLDSDTCQKVFIERLRSPAFEDLDVIRFISPCIHLPPSKMRAFKKDRLLDLLFRNDCAEMFCAYALSEKRKALVVEATQIVNTMDDMEFVTLLNHVAKTAASYE